jgi:hypothetical protein
MCILPYPGAYSSRLSWGSSYSRSARSKADFVIETPLLFFLWAHVPGSHKIGELVARKVAYVFDDFSRRHPHHPPDIHEFDTRP